MLYLVQIIINFLVYLCRYLFIIYWYEIHHIKAWLSYWHSQRACNCCKYWKRFQNSVRNCKYHPYLGRPSISQKKYTIKLMLFSVSMRTTETPHEMKYFVTFGTCKKIEVKRGHLVKKWEFGQTKKKFIISIFQN